jgi:nucleoside-diphosphate-sugar epimerase
MIRVLLTGASGFIGRHIMRDLASKDVAVIAVVRKGKEDLILASPNVEKIITTKNLFDENELWWIDLCKDVDIVIHAAWYVEPEKYADATSNLDCLTGSINLIKSLTKAGIKRFVGIGTCHEYDFTLGVLSEDTYLNPKSLYAATKTSLFFTARELLKINHISFLWLRPFYLYGEGEDERRLVAYLHKQLSRGLPANISSGEQICDYLNVKEASKKIVSAVLSDYVGVVNICSEIPITIKQIAEEIADHYGRRDLLVFGAKNKIDTHCIVGLNKYFKE